MAKFTTSKVTTPKDIQDSIDLMKAYSAWLEIDLAFQEIDEEMATWPGKYSPPAGCLLLSRNEAGEAIGCVALRSLGQGFCEMKRLYVDPKGRGLGVGKALAEAIIQEAKGMEYRAMRLDTLPSMDAGKKLYRELGFREIDAYYATPIEGTLFLELML